MVSAVEISRLESGLGKPVAVAAATPRRASLAFQPEAFFSGRTDGAGVVRDPFGRILRRCRVVTEGERDHAALRFDEVFTYDDGEVDVWRWVVTPGRDGRYVAAEARAGAGIAGERRGEDYLLAFRRPVGRLSGPLAPGYRTRFTLLTPDTAIKRAAVNFAGVPLGVLTAIHRRIA